MSVLDSQVMAWVGKAQWVVSGNPDGSFCRIGIQELEYEIFEQAESWSVDIVSRGETRRLLTTNNHHAITALLLWYAGSDARPRLGLQRTPYSRRPSYQLPPGVELSASEDNQLRLTWGEPSWAAFGLAEYSHALRLGQVVLSTADQIESALLEENGRPLFMSMEELDHQRSVGNPVYSTDDMPATWREYKAWKERHQ
jgi:hypothetical protein